MSNGYLNEGIKKTHSLVVETRKKLESCKRNLLQARFPTKNAGWETHKQVQKGALNYLAALDHINLAIRHLDMCEIGIAPEPTE